MKTHAYETLVHWRADDGEGTTSYTAYERDHTVSAGTKPPIYCSSDPAFRGNASRYNPEELLVGSLAACHMLWYLHLCAAAGITVVEYRDAACGTMEVDKDGSGRFMHVALKPVITVVSEDQRDQALALHHRAHECCFIARSVNFPVTVDPTVYV